MRIETDDDALIYMRYEGIVAGDALPRVLGGEAVPPATIISARRRISRPARRNMPG